MPEPYLFASCPNEEIILDFYKGQFESVYVIFHPFIRPVSISKELFCPATYPDKTTLMANCKPVSWAEVMKLTDLKSASEIDLGLKTTIMAVREEFGNKAFEAEIERLYENQGVVMPNEGLLPELLQDFLWQAIQHVGHDWLWVGDEFCTERKLEWIDDLKPREEFPVHGCFFTPDKSILLTTHWDSHFSFLCSSREMIDQVLNFHPFEGFYCDEKTEVYWSVTNNSSASSGI